LLREYTSPWKHISPNLISPNTHLGLNIEMVRGEMSLRKMFYREMIGGEMKKRGVVRLPYFTAIVVDLKFTKRWHKIIICQLTLSIGNFVMLINSKINLWWKKTQKPNLINQLENLFPCCYIAASFPFVWWCCYTE
jgi:hypothetical protein